ncbi:MAG: DUF4159 domain-containing protein [Planctomycetes bacterium]|nr:DUF4159 domain-containing protein [Planctomycetota bacterium]
MARIDRREFILKGTAAAAGLAGLGLPEDVLAQQTGRKLGTCGPPPQKSPQRQTSAEGMPPLPLPAVPLRRSEPKAEPTPPLMIAKLEYGTTQDWNTDPGDVDSLMRHVRSAVGLWYGWKQMNIKELVALHKNKAQCKIPCLYISGHEGFDFSKDERTALIQYLLDGGTLLGDACCGRTGFTDAFRAEVRKMFPQRPLDLLEMDHPVFRAFHKYTAVNYRSYKLGTKSETQGPPEILGMNLGCRAAVLLTPWDMSCGWDNHTHEHGARLLPGDAVRLGINIVSYIAALRHVAEVQSVTREVSGSNERRRQQFVLAQLRHHGDWNPDPNSTVQWLRHLASESSLAINFDLKPVDPTETTLAPFPFLYLTGFRDPRLSDDEIAALRRHIQAGGFLFLNNCSGYQAFDRHARRLIGRLFPDQKLAALPKEHALYRAFHTVTTGRDRQSNEPRPLELEGVEVQNRQGKARLALVYSKNDMITHLKQVSDPFGNGYDADSCRRLAVNLVAYALQN